MYNLDRFLKAHEECYEQALKEIKNGYKRTHWMWFIFPQIKGLGMSETAKYYEIKDINEAEEYFKNDILKSHLLEISNELLKLNETNILKIFTYPDNLKLQSSMTLFNYIYPNKVFKQVLNKFYNGILDDKTMEIIKNME